MLDLSNFLNNLAKVFPVFIIFAGLLGFYFREKLKQILSKSLAIELEELKAQFSREATELNAKMQREVEAYKVTLIAEAERVRAKQEIKTSMALRITEKRFLAISGLYEAHAGLDTSIAAHICTEQSTDTTAAILFRQRTDSLLQRFSKYSVAADAALIFIPADLNQARSQLQHLLITALIRRKEIHEPAIAQHDPAITELIQASLQFENRLRKILAELESLEAIS